jgi:chitin disaccharide deacetylase
MSIGLIVNADDYGHSPGVSAGIRDAHQHGLVTSTTAMMNMPGVEAALRQAQQTCPQLGLGVHLVLTTGLPVLPPAQVASLLDAQHRFPGEDGLIARLATLDPAEVRAEWRAQIEKFVAVTGRAPDHLDSHHHVSFFTAPLFQVILELAREQGCAIRLPLGDVAADIVSDLPAALTQPDLELKASLLREYQPRYPDQFLRSFYDASATQAVLLSLLAHLPDGTTEMMCHPGYSDQDLMDGSTYTWQRQAELAALTDAAVLAEVKHRGIRLMTFSHL